MVLSIVTIICVILGMISLVCKLRYKKDLSICFFLIMLVTALFGYLTIGLSYIEKVTWEKADSFVYCKGKDNLFIEATIGNQSYTTITQNINIYNNIDKTKNLYVKKNYNCYGTLITYEIEAYDYGSK